jgi:hypothetical protein
MSGIALHPEGWLGHEPPVVTYVRQVAARIRAWSTLTVEVELEESTEGEPIWPLCESCGEPRQFSSLDERTHAPPLGPLVLARSPAWAELICRDVVITDERARRRLAEIPAELDQLVALVARRTLDEGEFKAARERLRDERRELALKYVTRRSLRRLWSAADVEAFAGSVRARAVHDAAAIVAELDAWSPAARRVTLGADPCGG